MPVIFNLIFIDCIAGKLYVLDLAKCEYYLTSEADYKDYIPLNKLSNPSDQYLQKFKFHVLMLTQNAIKFLLSKSKRSINMFETTTRRYKTTTSYYSHDGYIEEELPTIPQFVRYSDWNDRIEYEISM